MKYVMIRIIGFFKWHSGYGHVTAHFESEKLTIFSEKYTFIDF